MKNIFLLINILYIFASSLSAQGWGKGMIVKPGWTITEGSNSTIVIKGGEHSTLFLEDDLTHSPSMIVRGNIKVDANSDSVRFQQYLTKDAWHFVSPAVFPEWNDTYLWTYLYAYDEPNWEWINLYLPLQQSLTAGMGYTDWNPSDGGSYPTPGDSIEQIGLPLSTSIDDYPLSYQYSSLAADSIGWNLVGNPFTAALDWNGDTSWDLQNVSPIIYLYDDANGSYDTYNYNGMQTGGADSIIAAGQAFFIKATAAGAHMDFPASQRFHRPAKELMKNRSYSTPTNTLRITVQKDGKENEILIGFDNKTSIGYDPDFDALYLASAHSIADIYAVEDEKKFIQYWNPAIESIESIPLAFEAHSEGVYHIVFNGVSAFKQAIWLEDKSTGEWQDLSINNSYSFAANTNDSPDRFILHFASPQGITEAHNSLSNIYAYDKSIVIRLANPKQKAKAYIYDLWGNKITQVESFTAQTKIPLATSRAYYLVQVILDNTTITKKILVQ